MQFMLTSVFKDVFKLTFRIVPMHFPFDFYSTNLLLLVWKKSVISCHTHSEATLKFAIVNDWKHIKFYQKKPHLFACHCQRMRKNMVKIWYWIKHFKVYKFMLHVDIHNLPCISFLQIAFLQQMVSLSVYQRSIVKILSKALCQTMHQWSDYCVLKWICQMCTVMHTCYQKKPL